MIAGQRLQSGQVLAQRFRLLHVVGEGGMGVVWAAGELATGRVVALKFLRTTNATDPKTYQRFLREARAAMAVRHPNVAIVSEVLETEAGAPFLVMDFLQGESLRERLDRDRVLSIPALSRIMVPITHAVEAAHAVGIVHRDLKPENIFLTKSNVQVLDFGIAKRLPRAGDVDMLTSLTVTGTLIGTPYYMAPEQLFGDDDIDVRVDVWALGIVLYECLAGVRPTEGNGLGQVIKIITSDQIRPLEQVAVHLPRDITQVVTQMLSRHRDGRPSLATVRRVLEGYGPTLYGTPLPDSLPRPSPPMVSSGPPRAGYAPSMSYAPTLDTPASTDHPALRVSEQKRGANVALWAVLGIGALGLVLAGGGTAVYIYVHDTGTSTTTGTGTLSPPTAAPTPEPTRVPLASAKSSAAGASPRPTARPTGPLPAPTAPAPTPTASATTLPTRRAEWSAFTDRNAYAGPELISAIRKHLPELQACLPVPTDDTLWATSIKFFWPKAAGVPKVSFAVRKNNADDASAEGMKARSCIQSTTSAWQLPQPRHDPDVGLVDAYVEGYAGYTWRAAR